MMLLLLLSVISLCAVQSYCLTCYQCDSNDHSNGHGHNNGHDNGQDHSLVKMTCHEKLCSQAEVCGFQLNFHGDKKMPTPVGCQFETPPPRRQRKCLKISNSKLYYKHVDDKHPKEDPKDEGKDGITGIYCYGNKCCRDESCVENAMIAAHLPFEKSHVQSTTHHVQPTTTIHVQPTTTRHIQPTTPAPYVCQDDVVSMMSNCQTLASEGACLGHLGVHVCQKTCGFCDYVESKFGDEGYCKDILKNNECASLSSPKFCADSLAVKLCPQSCGLCAAKLQTVIKSFMNRFSTTTTTTTSTTTTTPTTAPCIDTVENNGCASLPNICNDAIAHAVCPRFCNLCGGTKSLTTTIVPTTPTTATTTVTSTTTMPTTDTTMPTTMSAKALIMQTATPTMSTTASTMPSTSTTMSTTARTMSTPASTMPTTSTTLSTTSTTLSTTATTLSTTATIMSTASTTIPNSESTTPTKTTMPNTAIPTDMTALKVATQSSTITFPAKSNILTMTTTHPTGCVDELQNDGCALLPNDICEESVAHLVCPRFCNLCGEK